MSRYFTPKTEPREHAPAKTPEPSAGLEEMLNQGEVDTLEDRVAIPRALTGWRNELARPN